MHEPKQSIFTPSLETPLWLRMFSNERRHDQSVDKTHMRVDEPPAAEQRYALRRGASCITLKRSASPITAAHGCAILKDARTVRPVYRVIGLGPPDNPTMKMKSAVTT